MVELRASSDDQERRRATSSRDQERHPGLTAVPRRPGPAVLAARRPQPTDEGDVVLHLPIELASRNILELAGDGVPQEPQGQRKGGGCRRVETTLEEKKARLERGESSPVDDLVSCLASMRADGGGGGEQLLTDEEIRKSCFASGCTGSAPRRSPPSAPCGRSALRAVALLPAGGSVPCRPALHAAREGGSAPGRPVLRAGGSAPCSPALCLSPPCDPAVLPTAIPCEHRAKPQIHLHPDVDVNSKTKIPSRPPNLPADVYLTEIGQDQSDPAPHTMPWRLR
ncbi:hypothetical protein HU200_051399 [Digitaria exilis]|uniref:Uncharacterized protein n=1 Tax=Digitaria exilis TaxID=1010633 RepID=A0A835E7W3_9POAL|nr:hypothetical protein HU200_051399 [Digitaria exilis]